MRRVTREDADELAGLDMLLFPENCFNEHTLATEVELGLGWVICREGRIVAYALVRDDGLILDVTRLGVHPDQQKRGYGTQLLTEVLRLERTTILTVRKSNSVALKLYRRLGFEIVGTTCHGGDESWLMRALPAPTSVAC